MSKEQAKLNLPITIAELEAFLAVAELRSFSRAAEKLHITQPAVTGRVARLERTLGYKLVDRSTRTICLTAGGERVRLIAEQAFRELRLLFDQKPQAVPRKDQVLRVVCTGGISALFLPPVLHAFAQQCPQITVRVVDRSPTAAIEAIRTRRADLGIMAPGLTGPDIAFTPLVDDECVVVTPMDHPLGTRPAVTLSEVLDFPILMADDQLPLRRTVQKLADERGLQVRRAAEGRYPSSILNMFSMVASGYGIMLQPQSLTRIPVELSLLQIPISDARIPHTYGLVELEGSRHSPAAEQFRQFLIQAVKPELYRQP